MPEVMVVVSVKDVPPRRRAGGIAKANIAGVEIKKLEGVQRSLTTLIDNIKYLNY